MSKNYRMSVLFEVRVFGAFIALASVWAPSAGAAPIKNSVPGVYKAVWLPSNLQSCPTVCKAAAMLPESASFSVPSLGMKKTYDCKGAVTLGAPTPGSGYVFGNNFGSPNYAPYCIVSLPNGSTQRLGQFYCLCVS